jgi:hypothetical protein
MLIQIMHQLLLTFITQLQLLMRNERDMFEIHIVKPPGPMALGQF